MKTSAQIRLALVFLSSIALLPAQPPKASDGDRSILPAIKQIEPFIEKGMQKTGVPGVAVAIVYRDKVVYLKGFGVRKAGQPARINPGTVFQLASLSKPIASTIVANLVGRREVKWDDRIIDLDPEFKLSNPDVTQRLTIRDLLSHRSGLPTSSGDGARRPWILTSRR